MAYTLLGTYTGTCTNVLGGTLDNSKFLVDVYYEQSITNNTTSLQIKPYVTKSGHGESVTWYFKLDGNDYYNVFCNTYVNSRVDGGTAYKTINHNNDGTCTFNLNVSVETSYTQGANANLNNHCMKWGKLSVNITLPTIPRASSFTVPSFTCGSAGTISISRASTSFTHKVLYTFGSYTGTISSNATTSCSWTPDNSLATQIPNALSGVGTITVETYNGSTKIGTASKTFTLYVNGSMYPTIGSLTLEGVNLWNGYYLKNHSQVKATIGSAAGVQGSTIKNYNISGTGLNVTSASGTSSKLNATGTNTYTATVTDSRGRTTTKTNSIYIYDYNNPTATNINVYRCDSNGNPNDEGSYIKVTCQTGITNIADANLNAKTITIKTKESNGTSWVTKVNAHVLSSYYQTYQSAALSSYSIASAYDVQIILKDSLNTSTYEYKISVASCVMNIEPGGVGIGKYWEQGALDVKGTIYSDGHKVPVIKREDGVMEAGQYIDLHHGNFDNDFDVRFEVTNTRCLEVIPMGEWATIKGKLAINGNTGYNLDLLAQSDGVALGNGGIGKYLRIANNGWLYYNGDIAINKLGILDSRGSNPLPNHYAGYQMGLDFKTAQDLGMNDTASATWCNVLTTKGWSSDAAAHPVSQLSFNGDALYYRSSNGSNAWKGWCRIPMLHYINGYWGFGIANNDAGSWLRSPSTGFIPYESGGNSSSLGTQGWIWKEIHGKYIYMQFGRCIWGSSSSDIMVNSAILPDTNGTKWLGWSNNKWAGVYASNGYIQTSDMRYKSDIKDIDDEIFFNMIKNTGVHSYVLNANRVDLDDGIMPLTMDEADQEDIQIGIIAQELAQYEGSEYILNYDDEVGYTVNNYNLISAVMAALKVEIAKREEVEEKLIVAEEKLTVAEERIKTLEDRLTKIEELLNSK